MSKATNPASSLSAVEPAQTSIVLSTEDYDKLRAAVHAVQDAVRDAEIAAAEAKVAIGRAAASQALLLRSLAQRYPGLDPDASMRLGPHRTLVMVEGES